MVGQVGFRISFASGGLVRNDGLRYYDTACVRVFLVVHLYLSLLPMNRQALNAMFGDGRLPIDYVKSHHPIWHEKLTGKRAELTTTEKVEPSVAEEELTTS